MDLRFSTLEMYLPFKHMSSLPKKPHHKASRQAVGEERQPLNFLRWSWELSLVEGKQFPCLLLLSSLSSNTSGLPKGSGWVVSRNS